MSTTAFTALFRRDMYLYITDRRAVIMSIAAPILIGSFFGYLFSGAGNDAPASRMPVAVIDNDRSGISQRLVTALAADRALDVGQSSLEEARARVRSGKTTVAVAVHKGFGYQAARSFFRNVEKPEIQLLSLAATTELIRLRV